MADTIINSANSTAATEREIILSIVQDELLDAAMLRPTVREFPANKGDKSVEIPKFSASFDGPAAINTDGATASDFQDIAFSTDVITLSEHVALPYRITDRASMQSAVSVEAEAARSAGRQMGIYMDDQIIAKLQQASAAGPDHQVGLDGRANQSEAGDNALTLAGVTEARKLLNKQNLSPDGRFLVISPDQEKELLDLDQFRNAEKYGSREALLNGEIGRIYGFRVMVHNRLAQYECFAYHKDAVGIAVQKEVEFETDRADVRLAATDYAFRMLMGSVVLDGGKKVVWMLGAA
jgi:N4-gp56 family major capsid protein